MVSNSLTQEWRASWHKERWLQIAPCLVLLLLASSTVAAYIVAPTFWFDEATFLVNVRDVQWHDILQPLPFYDQASPFLFIALEKLLYTIFGMSEHALRAPSLLAYCAMAVLALRFPGLKLAEKLIFAISLCAGVVVADYAIQAKHYLVEMLSLFLMLFVYLQPAERTPPTLVRLGVVLLAIGAAPTAPIVITGLLVGLVADELWRKKGPFRFQSLVAQLRFLAPLIVGGIVNGIFYIVYLKPAADAQVQVYRYTFDYGFADGASFPLFVLRRLFTIVAEQYHPIGVLVAAFAAIGAIFSFRRYPRHAAVFTAILLVVIFLNSLGLFPLLVGRFSFVLLPTLAFFVAIGVASAADKLASWLPSMALVTLVAIILAAPALRWIVFKPHGQQANRSLAVVADRLHAGATDDKPILVTMGSQPVIDAYFGPFGARLACTDSPAGMVGWTDRCSHRRRPASQESFANAQTPWYVMNYIAHVSFGENEKDVPPAVVSQWTDEYTNFMAQQICAHRSVYLFNVHLRKSFVDRIERATPLSESFVVTDDNREKDGSDGLLKLMSCKRVQG